MTKSQIASKAASIIETALENCTNREAKYRLEEMSVHAAGYSEPGYDSDKVIATGNWNDVRKWNADTRQFDVIDDTPSKVGEQLEKLGCELEWGDEWANCSNCGKLVRTSGNSYGWTPSYAILQSDYVCKHCIEHDKAMLSDYLENLENDPALADTFNLDLTKHGYKCLFDDLESGWYGGQNSDPKVIAKSLRDKQVFRFIFQIDSVGQFDCDFSVFVHEDEFEKVTGPIKTDGVDPADVLKHALQNAPVKLVSPQDFADGKL